MNRLLFHVLLQLYMRGSVLMQKGKLLMWHKVMHSASMGMPWYALLLVSIEKVIEHPLVVCYTMERFTLNLECYEVALRQSVKRGGTNHVPACFIFHLARRSKYESGCGAAASAHGLGP